MMKNLLIPASLLLAFASTALQAERISYTIDPVHSGVDFRIRHIVNQVPGAFTSFSGEIHFNKEDPAERKAVATSQIASVDTRDTQRDNHLRSDDFFDAENHPEMTFESTSWESAGKDAYKVTGDLTLNGQTHPVTLDVTFLGEVKGDDKIRSGWKGTTTIERARWGIDGFTAMLGDEVAIELNIQAHRPLNKEEG